MILLTAALLLAGERTALGVWERWGAMRDSRPLRCFALVQPVLPGGATDTRGAFAAVSARPDAARRHGLYVRLSRRPSPTAPITLAIGERRFALVGEDRAARAADAATDRAIVGAMRGARAMSVSAIDAAGRAFADHYPLAGAATAIDAAMLGCTAGR